MIFRVLFLCSMNITAIPKNMSLQIFFFLIDNNCRICSEDCLLTSNIPELAAGLVRPALKRDNSDLIQSLFTIGKCSGEIILGLFRLDNCLM